MKRKLMTVMLMLLIVCLCGSIVILAACNPEKDNKDYSKDTTTMFDEVMTKMEGYKWGDALGIDVAASYVADNKTAFTLTGKGNLDFKKSGADENSNFVIELNKVDGETETTVFGIAYEVIEGKPYFFINLLGDYKKIEGYSLSAIYSMLNKDAEAAVAAADEGLVNVKAILLNMFFGAKGTVKDGVYSFDFNILNTVNSLRESLSVIVGQIGMTEDQVNGLIARIFGGLSYTVNDEVVNVTDITKLAIWIEMNFNMSGKIEFKFDGDAFKSVNIYTSDYSNSANPDAAYAVKIDKAELAVTDSNKEAFKDFPLSADQRKNAEAFNLLNFQINGSAVSRAEDGTILHRYNISINSDINPMPLLNLIGSSKKADILSALSQMGYFNFTVDEVFDDETEPVNILTLHSKFEEGNAIVQLNGYTAIVLVDASIGGVYDFETLVDVISSMTASGEAGIAAAEEESEAGIDIAGMIFGIIGMFSTDDITNNGLTLDVGGLVDMLGGLLGGDSTIIGALNDVLGAVFVNDVKTYVDNMTFKVSDTTFGACEYVESEDIKYLLADGSRVKNKDFIDRIVSIESEIKSEYEYGQDMSYGASRQGSLQMKGRVIGASENEDSADVTGFIFGSNFDPYKVGKQNVTLYIALDTQLMTASATLAGLAGLDVTTLPLFGLLPYNVNLTVRPFDADAEVSVNANDNVRAMTTDNLFTSSYLGSSSIKLTIAPAEGAERIYSISKSSKDISVFKDGKDVTADVYDDGKISKAGTYKLRFSVGAYYDEVTVLIDEAVYTTSDGKPESKTITLGDTVDMNYKVYVKTAEGTTIDCSDNITLVTYKNDNDSYMNTNADRMAELFDITGTGESAVYKLKVTNDIYLNETFWREIKFTYESRTLSIKTTEQKIQLPKDRVAIRAAEDNPVINQSLDGYWTITLNGVDYSVTHQKENGIDKWIAADAKGTKLDQEISVVIKRASDDVPAVFNNDGVITNLTNELKAGSRNDTFSYTITVGDVSWSSDFTIRQLYLTNQNRWTNTNYIKWFNAENIYYSENGVQVALEFKYIESEDKYAIVKKGTDEIVHEVTVTVTKDGQAVSLIDGKFPATAVNETFEVTLETTINGINQKCKATYKVTKLA